MNDFADDLNKEVMRERHRCERIVSAARSGDIDGDFRTLLHFIESGDLMKFNPARGKYEPDSARRDRELLEEIETGKP